jgi:LuxR family transcriptional regulator, maltose regulon positive regulatory protein
MEAARDEVPQVGAPTPKPPREQLAETAARLADFRRRQGRYPEARRLLNQAGDLPEARLVEAAMTLDRGDAAAAAVLAKRLLRSLPGDEVAVRAGAREVLAVAGAANDDRVVPRRAAAELAEIAASAGEDAPVASAAFVAGVLAFHERDLETAHRLLRRSVGVSLAAGDVYETARARLWLSRTLLAQDDPSGAEQEALSAVKLYGSVAARLGVREAWAALAAARGDTSGRSPISALNEPLYDFPLSAREIEVLKLVGEGLSNPQIAKRLVLSPHTVHRHVANIMAKLDVTSRTAAVGMAARRGVL